MTDSIEAVRQALQRATCTVAFTGAGISAESGVPTFRGVGGLWREHSPEKLATPEAFAENPRLVWEWYDWRRSLIRRAEPNPGHRALAEMERRQACRPAGQGGFTLVTQNVDGLHERAGSGHPVKLHGDIWIVRCADCGREERNEQVPLVPLPPRCSCGGLLRPGVVWFGELLPADAWRRAVEASARADVFLVVGTSAVVYPAAGLIEIAHRVSAQVVIINPEPTPLDSLADRVLRGRAGDVLVRLI